MPISSVSELALNPLFKVDQNQVIFPTIPKFQRFEERKLL